MFKKNGRENQNTHFVLSTVFPKILPCMRQCGGKIW